jgi:ferric-dicitrate binding protein FerR (iron transport regulator)
MTGPTDPATLAALRNMAQQAADIALSEHAGQFTRLERLLQQMTTGLPKPADIPGPLKWAAGILSALMTAAIVGIFVWLVTSVNEMQQTLVRIDERQKAQVETLDSRFNDHDRRISRLEKLNNVEGGL